MIVSLPIIAVTLLIFGSGPSIAIVKMTTRHGALLAIIIIAGNAVRLLIRTREKRLMEGCVVRYPCGSKTKIRR